MKLSFSKLHRLLFRREFRMIYQNGRKHVGKRLIFFYLRNEPHSTRLGITITKKWGKAHDRNRFKRVIREGFRKTYPQLPGGILLNVHPREGYQDLTPEDVELELKKLSNSCGQIKSQPTKSSHSN